MKYKLYTHTTRLRHLLFTILLIPCHLLQAQLDQCPIDVTNSPCYGLGIPCILANPSTLCLEFVNDTLSFGATLLYTYSELSSGGIDFNGSDFIVSNCSSSDEFERRRLRARRRTVISEEEARVANMENLCTEWDIIWNFGAGNDPVTGEENAQSCTYIVVQVTDDGGPAPLPQVKENLFIDAEKYLEDIELELFRNDPKDFLINHAAYADHIVVDEPNLMSMNIDDLEVFLETLDPLTTITRTWGLTDWCGNQTTVEQEITLYRKNVGPLAALYNATDGDNWTNKNNWLNGGDPCDPLARWNGVYCNTLGNVETIYLDNNGLNGFIPSELGKLSSLKFLKLDHNQLKGTIPPELGSLSNLEEVWLNDNQLTGSIPGELGNLNKLVDFFVHNNQLLCFESGLVGLCDNPSLGVDTHGNLGTLDWKAFCATGAETCSNAGISILAILYQATDGDNWFNNTNWLNGGDPCDPASPWYGILCDGEGNITEIDLPSNGLNGFIPPELAALTQLEVIDFFDNSLGGNIPPELSQLANLLALDLGFNQLSGTIPPQLGRLNKLDELWLDFNELTGSIPPELGHLTALLDLYLGYNQLSGDIPPELGNLTNLIHLALGKNQLGGSVPGSFSNLSNLELLTLDVNQLLCFEPGINALCNNGVLSTVRVDNNPGNLDWDAFCSTGAGTCGEVDALIALYNATDGDNWNNNTNWLNGMDPCDAAARWYGVACDGSGNVTALNLGGNNLNGFIPPELGYLTQLRTIDFFNNRLKGLIPAELSQLTNLWTLDLGANQLKGNIPPELGALSELRAFLLDGNQLNSFIPFEFGNLTNLTSLWLTSNKLIGEIPFELGNLTNLISLDLSGNRLIGSIPPELGSLANLTDLLLSDNELSGKIPPELGDLSNLIVLELSNNQLEGSVISELSNLSLLQILTLDDNQLDCFESGLSALCGKNGLTVSVSNNPGALDWNAFCTTGAGTCGDIHALIALYEATEGRNWNDNTNWLNDMDPCAVATKWFGIECDGNGNVTQINLTSNSLEGFLPTEMEYLQHLQVLNLYDNKIGRWIPPELGKLTNLELLYLTFNRFIGEIPPELGSLTNLQYFDLANNQLIGEIPPELGGLTNLYHLSFYNNRLQGIIPQELANLTNLTLFFLAINQLEGGIPAWIGNFTNLSSTDLSKNQFTGVIPPELSQLGELTYLNLSFNQLSGNIPPDLGFALNLEQLYLNNNQLSGSVPGELWIIYNLLTLTLDNNQLSCFEPDLMYLCEDGLTVTAANNPGNLDWTAFCATGAGTCPDNILISPIINLQGAYDSGTGLMRDDLRTNPAMPLIEPYTDLGYFHFGGGGGEQTSQPVFDLSGVNAIVDWVFLELRDKSNTANIVATRSALLQRDGNVVDVDGFSPVAFDLPPDDYYLVVKHRNHLGVMSAAPIPLSTTETVFDFTTNLNNTFGAGNGIATLSDGKLGLYSGDFNRNGQVQNTDYATMVLTLGTAGYVDGDFDLNGQVQNTDLQLKLVPNIGKGQAF